MKIVKITSFYRDFLNSYYENNPNVIIQNYDFQYRHLMEQGYAWADYFKRHFENLGVECIEIVYNAENLQKAWAEKFNVNINANILLQQIKYYQPDVVFFQDIVAFSGSFIKEIRNTVPSVKLVFGHCCSPFAPERLSDYSAYDFLITCAPFVDIFRNNNIECFEFAHGFESSHLEKINNENHFDIVDFIFIGSFVQNKDFHEGRTKIIEDLLQNNIHIKMYSSNFEIDNLISYNGKLMAYWLAKSMKNIGMKSLAQQIPIVKKFLNLNEPIKKQKYSKAFVQSVIKESLYGIEMLKALSKSKIGFNFHGGVAGDFAANVRMFEVTGVGSLLLTDHKKNIKDYFEPDYEIVTYKNAEECIEKVNYLLNHEEERKRIAKAGQLRCLNSHSIKNRVEYLKEILDKEMKKVS